LAVTAARATDSQSESKSALPIIND